MRRKEFKTFSDILNAPYHWPASGDRLFVAATADEGGAGVEQSGYARFVFMTRGYKDAADALVEEALADQPSRYDLIYPIIYCYRQYIELSLKLALGSYGRSVGVDSPGNTHDLKKLLKSFRKMLRSYGSGHDNRANIVVSKCILEFHRLDPTSFSFRYSTGRDGRPYPIALKAINLMRLRDTMERLGHYFDGTDGYLSSLSE